MHTSPQKHHHDHEQFNEALLQWKGTKHHVHERGLIWFIGFIGAISFFVWYGINDGSWTMAVAFILVAVVYYLEHQKSVRHVNTIISRAGIKVGNKIYHYNEIDGFWLIYNPPFVKTFNFNLLRNRHKVITVHLDDADQAMIRHVLQGHIPEIHGKQETLIEVFGRAFKL